MHTWTCKSSSLVPLRSVEAVAVGVLSLRMSLSKLIFSILIDAPAKCSRQSHESDICRCVLQLLLPRSLARSPVRPLSLFINCDRQLEIRFQYFWTFTTSRLAANHKEVAWKHLVATLLVIIKLHLQQVCIYIIILRLMTIKCHFGRTRRQRYGRRCWITATQSKAKSAMPMGNYFGGVYCV